VDLDLNSYVAVLASEAVVLASAADDAGLDTPVPTCPGWTINDLALHMGEVHRWATAVVTGRATKLSDVPGDSLGALPERAGTTDWVRRGAARLCEALATADPSVEYAAFLADPIAPRVLFWARRQTMETSVHRVDAESALGVCTALAPDVALDGIDEFLTGFLPRARTPLHSDRPLSLLIAPEFSDRRWTVAISQDLPVNMRGACEADSPADCIVSGLASDIYLALWNRVPLDVVKIEGDAGVIEQLRTHVQIRWS
jgi:uncharacterized protein (TIGR03083 family)